MDNKILLPVRYNLYFIIFLLLLIPLHVSGAGYYFYVQFTDKNNSPYSLSQPSQFLSARAIERRTNFALAYDSTDLPVNPAYLQQVRNLGVEVHSKSKWMNGITVLVPDSSVMGQVRALPFVRFTEYTGLQGVRSPVRPKRMKAIRNVDYGTADFQISQVGGKFLHNLGLRGGGIHVGVIDAGFMNVNSNPAFDSLRLQGRLLGTKDIIAPGEDALGSDTHGANVLSIMAGNLPGQYLGTAPDASYWLIRTEYGPTEYKAEVDFWCAGIEFADSVGVDLINSSLGYYVFDDPSMNFTYANMNGKVSRASLAASLAAKKGIVVVVSAGNEGNKSWRYIGSPADAEGIVTVGAIQTNGLPASFTSFGPSSDGRVKPEISALGAPASIVNIDGLPAYGNGTSYSSPVMAGMLACYLQAARRSAPPYNVESLIRNVFKSANLYTAPTTQLGYGIPNFELATRNLPYFASLNETDANGKFGLSYDVPNKTIHVWIPDRNEAVGKTLSLYSVTGSLLARKYMDEAVAILPARNLAPGIYAVSISGNGKTDTRKIVVH